MRNKICWFVVVGVMSFAAHAELRLGIEPRGSAAETQQAFTPLAEYLARELGEPVKLVIAKDFVDYGRQLKNMEHDLSFAAPATILYHRDIHAADLLAVAVDRESGAQLRGIFLVQKDSPMKSLTDLKGKRVAFVAKSSQGYLVQSYLLRQAGIDPDTDIQTDFTQRLDRAVSAVLNGDAQAAGVGDVVFSKLKGKLDLTSLRVLSTSPPTPNWVIIGLRPELNTKLRRTLLKLTPGSEHAAAVLGQSTFIGLQSIDTSSLTLLREAVRAEQRGAR